MWIKFYFKFSHAVCGVQFLNMFKWNLMNAITSFEGKFLMPIFRVKHLIFITKEAENLQVLLQKMHWIRILFFIRKWELEFSVSLLIVKLSCPSGILRYRSAIRNKNEVLKRNLAPCERQPTSSFFIFMCMVL